MAEEDQILDNLIEKKQVEAALAEIDLDADDDFYEDEEELSEAELEFAADDFDDNAELGENGAGDDKGADDAIVADQAVEAAAKPGKAKPSKTKPAVEAEPQPNPLKSPPEAPGSEALSLEELIELSELEKPKKSEKPEIFIPSEGSRVWSKVGRVLAWVAVVLVALILALLATAYIAGFGNVFEMIDWLREVS